MCPTYRQTADDQLFQPYQSTCSCHEGTGGQWFNRRYLLRPFNLAAAAAFAGIWRLVVMVAAVSMLFHLGQPLNYIQISGMIVIFSGCLLMPLKKIAEFSFRHYISQGFLLIMLVAIGTTGYTVLDSQALKTYKESLVFEDRKSVV